MRRQNFSSGSHFEERFAYSRAVKVEDRVWLSGTIGMDYETRTISPDPAAQIVQLIANMQAALERTGATLADVVQITLYVSEAAVMDAIQPELVRAFGQVRPTNAARVVGFPFPDIKVEIAATAIVGCGSADATA